jgi:hypothetical protein
MNPKEAFTYLNGDVTELGFIESSQIGDILVHAKIIIAKDAGTQAIQEAQLTLQIIERYFAYPPEIQMVARPILKTILFALGHDDVDTLLPAPMLPPPGVPGMPGAPGMVQPGQTTMDPNPEVQETPQAQPPVDPSKIPPPSELPQGSNVEPFEAHV